MARKRKYDYFEAFVKISEYAVEYSEALVEFLEKYYDENSHSGVADRADVLEHLKSLHEIEEASDEVAHEVIANLVNEFVTPIEREDILELADELDTVVDELDEVLQRMHMYCSYTITPDIIEMAHVVHKATVAVQTACQKLTYFKKSHSIKDYIVEIQHQEDKGDQVYIRAVHNTYSRAQAGGITALDAIGLAGVLSALERCCDACEDVGGSITNVIMKNS